MQDIRDLDLSANPQDHRIFNQQVQSNRTSILGSSDETGISIAVDSYGCTYVTGYTDSTDFPTQNPFQGTYGGEKYDAFVTKFSSSGSTLIYSNYLSGKAGSEAWDIASDNSNCIYVTVVTTSEDFPLLNPFQIGHFFL
jgi:hypothetical protein